MAQAAQLRRGLPLNRMSLRLEVTGMERRRTRVASGAVRLRMTLAARGWARLRLCTVYRHPVVAMWHLNSAVAVQAEFAAMAGHAASLVLFRCIPVRLHPVVGV